MQLITNSYVYVYLKSYMAVRYRDSGYQKSPILTIEFPESNAMLTAAGNHQLKESPLSTKLSREILTLSVTSTESHILSFIISCKVHVLTSFILA